MKYVLITGVSTGIGLDLCKYLLSKGFGVFGSVRKKEDADRLKSTLGSSFTALQFDVTRSDQISDAVEVVSNKLGTQGLFALINNAGIAEPGPLMYLKLEDLKRQIDVNVYGVFRVTNSFLPLLGAVANPVHPAGKIIHISSVSGIFNSPFMGAYCISKHALESMSDIYRRELLIFGIDLVVIEPGQTKSEIWKKAREKNLDEKFGSSLYKDIIKNADKIIERSEKNAIPTEKLVKRVYKVLQSKKPKTRYIVSNNALGMKILSRWVPDRIVDRMIMKTLKKGDRVRPV